MYGTQLPVVNLFRNLGEYEGDDAYTDNLEAWPENNPDELRWLADFERRTNKDWAASNEDECRLYSLFRVISLLLLRFQKGRADSTDYQGPAIEIEGIRLFLEQLGFHVPETIEYHPFYHEILSVNQAGDSKDTVEVT